MLDVLVRRLCVGGFRRRWRVGQRLIWIGGSAVYLLEYRPSWPFCSAYFRWQSKAPIRIVCDGKKAAPWPAAIAARGGIRLWERLR
jgi:hypothetical protein